MRSSWIHFVAAALVLGITEVVACSSFSGQSAAAALDAGDAGPFCDGIDAFFCWSFDTPPYVVGPVLAEVSSDGGSTALVLTDAAKSFPYAAETFSTSDAGAYHGVILQSGFVGTADIRCDADVRVEGLAPGTEGLSVIGFSGQDGSSAQLIFEPSQETDALVAFVATSQSDAVKSDASSSFTPIANVPFDQSWVHVSLALVGKTIVATEQATGSSLETLTVDRHGPAILNNVFFGASCTKTCQVSIDNIRCAAPSD